MRSATPRTCRDDIDAVTVGTIQVHEHQVDRFAFQRLDRSRRIGDRSDDGDPIARQTADEPVCDSRAPNHDEYTDVFDHRCSLNASALRGHVLKGRTDVLKLVSRETEAMMSRRANRLATETSPYLLQHAHNPVDWYPWGPEAVERAKADDKPILLSIGYAACHWCHVMERESFEDEDTAALMNEHFVAIKVDREERPDLDAIYMDAAQAMTGQRRLADDSVPDAGRQTVLRRHVLPAGAAARAAVVPAGADRDRPGMDRTARRGRDAGRRRSPSTSRASGC